MTYIVYIVKVDSGSMFLCVQNCIYMLSAYLYSAQCIRHHDAYVARFL